MRDCDECSKWYLMYIDVMRSPVQIALVSMAIGHDQIARYSIAAAAATPIAAVVAVTLIAAVAAVVAVV